MILPMSKQMKLMYIESCKQVAADIAGFKKGFRKKFRICPSVIFLRHWEEIRECLKS